MTDSYRRRRQFWRTSGLGWTAYWPLILLLVVMQFSSPSWAQIRVPFRSMFVVGVTPRLVTLTAGGVNQFSAHLQNSSDQTVTWSLSPQLGTVDSNGRYTAPQSISAAQGVILTATSVTDPQKFATAKITLIPLTVSVNPGSATLRAGQAMRFAAGATNAVNGNAFRRVVLPAPSTSYLTWSTIAVRWSLSPQVGTVDSNGLYTAPQSISTAQDVILTATSVTDPTKSASATVTLNPSANVTVSPASVNLTQSQTRQFSATVAEHRQ